jgi:hypothetical protein
VARGSAKPVSDNADVTEGAIVGSAKGVGDAMARIGIAGVDARKASIHGMAGATGMP